MKIVVAICRQIVSVTANMFFSATIHQSCPHLWAGGICIKMSQQCPDVKSFFDIRSWAQRWHWSDAYLISDVVGVGADDVDDDVDVA